MNMESPVRICLGAALVVNLLLLSSTTVNGNALPLETTSTTVNDDRSSKYNRLNGSWIPKNKQKSPDVSLNELNPKDSTSEEHTDKNAKYKDRGRVRFHSEKTSTDRPRRVRGSTEASKLVIVTPTPEVKKPAEIIDSMKTYMKTKMPVVYSSSTTPVAVKKEAQSAEEEYEDEEEEEDKESFEKYTSSKFHDTNFFTIPSFNDDEFSHESTNESSDNKVKKDYSSPTFSSFSSFFPKETSYGYNDDHDSFKSESFFNFDTELTTPKNDFFDKKFRKISTSIIKKLDSIKVTSPPLNTTNVQIVKENLGLERLSNNTPTNTSTVFIKNTKEIRLSDNEGASSANKELSDVKGTSIYYEMSVLSTENYIINHSDDDCDNDTLSFDPTVSSSSEEELASLKATQPTLLPSSTKPTLPETHPESVSTSSSEVVPISSVLPYFNSVNSVPVSTQNTISTTDRVTRVYSSSFSRNRSYSKRLNLTGNKDSPNNVTPINEVTANPSLRPLTRKFHHTTPRTRPVWMAPKRNITRTTFTRPSPSTIYSEHFNIKDKFTTSKSKQPIKTILTTVSSEIDPVLQTDVSGTKKIVHSQSISDNSIPSVWKRGSTKYATSTAASAEDESEVSELEIPPTSTAWALASLISPPVLPSSIVNATGSTQKTVDENELQKVGEVIDKKETTTSSTTTTTVSPISNDIITKKLTEVNQNKLPWQPIFTPTSPASDIISEVAPTETKFDRQPAESNVSFSTDSVKVPIKSTERIETTKSSLAANLKEIRPLWVPSSGNSVKTTTEKVPETFKETIQPVDATRSTGFESITKLPSDVTTPSDETAAGSELNHTVTDEKPKPTADYEITTIRFSYVPTEAVTETFTQQEDTTQSVWHPVYPTRTKTTVKELPVTTYRPKYMTTTDMPEVYTTTIPETTPTLEISSQVVENVTEPLPETTEMFEQTNTEIPTTTKITTTTTTTPSTTTSTTTQPTTTITTTTTEKITTTPSTTTTTTTTVPTTTEIETTTIIVEIVTEINSERTRPTAPTTTEPTTETDDCVSEENSDSNEVITQNVVKTTTSTTTTPLPTTPLPTTPLPTIVEITTEEITTQVVTQQNAKIFESTTVPEEVESTTYLSSKTNDDSENLTSYGEDFTTEASTIVMSRESESGAAVAIAVSTIGVIALILLIGLLLVVRRRGRRGIYAQRCTPVSLDAYSLDSVSVGHRKGNHRLRASKRSYGNPAYDDEVTSHPMQYPALANFALDVESMTAEFSEIPSVTVRPDEVPPGCEDKNRYSNVLPLPETRVPLKRIGNDPTTEYINANFITGPGNIRNYYIACQAPLPNTVVDFWRMIWEQNSRLVVMLTEYMENGVEKCYEYLPPSEITDNKRIFGDFKIILKKREQRDKYAISSVQLINLTTRTWREITHLWYFWPAKGVPEDYDSIIDFLCEMRSYMKISQTAKEYDEEGVEVIYGDQNRSSFSNLTKLREENGSGNGLNVYSPAKAEEQLKRANANNGTLGRMKAASEIEGVRPCVVTCASGAGRAAALVALDVCARALAAGAAGAGADVPRVVRELRAQRPHSLSNKHHYIFLYKVLSEYGNKMMGGGGVDTI